MTGGNILVAALLLLFAVALWEQYAAHLNRLPPHELNLRRASQPFGVAALVGLAVAVFGVHGVGSGVAGLLPYSISNRLQAALIGLAALYALAAFVTGVKRCWGVRSDPMLTPRALIKLVLGLAVTVYLWRNYPWMQLSAADEWAFLGLALAFCAGLWCAATGAVRLFLLTVGGGNALALINRHIRQTQIVMRPARSRPWWQFW